jgi:hypothetical protein
MQFDGLLEKASSDETLPEIIACIDPGTKRSGIVIFVNNEIFMADKVDNSDVSTYLDGCSGLLVLVEKIVLHNMAGSETCSTIFFSGRIDRICETSEHNVAYASRSDVKKTLVCAVKGIKDSHIRQKCLLELGPEFETLKFRRLMGDSGARRLSADMWSSIALYLSYVKDKSIFSKEY